MASIRLPSMGLPVGRRVSVVKPQNVNIAQMASTIVPKNFSSTLANTGVPMKVKPINVRNKGFNV